MNIKKLNPTSLLTQCSVCKMDDNKISLYFDLHNSDISLLEYDIKDIVVNELPISYTVLTNNNIIINVKDTSCKNIEKLEYGYSLNIYNLDLRTTLTIYSVWSLELVYEFSKLSEWPDIFIEFTVPKQNPLLLIDYEHPIIDPIVDPNTGEKNNIIYLNGAVCLKYV